MAWTTQDGQWSRSYEPWREWEAATTWTEAMEIAIERHRTIKTHFGMPMKQFVYKHSADFWCISTHDRYGRTARDRAEARA